MNFTWRPTTAPVQTRYDDIWFVNPQVGWGVNSAGQIVHTDDAGATWTIQHTVDADTWLRCMSFTSPTDGWVGSITRRQRLWRRCRPTRIFSRPTSCRPTKRSPYGTWSSCSRI